MNLIKQKTFAFFAFIVSAFAFLFAPLSYAQSSSSAPDVSKLTDSLDFSTVVTAILDVGVAVVGVYITYRAVKLVLSAIRSS